MAATTDWERIELDYRAGLLSLREIAGVHGITEGAIRKRAKRDTWVRDIAAKVQAKADDLVRRQAVREKVRTGQKEDEKAVIDANAQVIAQVRTAHRDDIRMARQLCMDLLNELKSTTADLPEFHNLHELLKGGEAPAKALDIMQAVISLPERTKTMKALAESLKVLIGLEREAYELATDEGKKPVNHSELLREIAAALPN